MNFNIKPIYKKWIADLETPLSLFLKVKGSQLLESVEKGKYVGRYSIIGIGKRVKIEIKGNEINFSFYKNNKISTSAYYSSTKPLLKIREYFSQFKTNNYHDLPPFWGGAIGYLGYETVQYFEDINIKHEQADLPDGILIIPEITLIYDGLERIVTGVIPVSEEENSPTEEEATTLLNKLEKKIQSPLKIANINMQQENKDINSNFDKKAFIKMVEKAKEEIIKGNIIQIVLSQKFSIATDTSPFSLYRILRMLNPSPYLFFLDMDDFQIIGSSPEVMVRVHEREVLLKPIAGTRPRGKTLEEDLALEKELLNDPKELAEHIMLVDLGRNDLGRIAKANSVEISDYQTIERYSHVMHIVSSIKATLNDGEDIFDVLQAVFPAGTLSGAPKVKAMELISKFEKDRRGPYGGMVLNLGYNGNMDSCITIRTIVLKDGIASVQAGAGIVYDSIPENEYQETINKANALLKTITEGLKI
jgi:anthranilate synthase component I